MNTRNTRDWPGPYLTATFTYQGWKDDGTTLDPYEAVQSAGASTVLPGDRQVISTIPEEDYEGMTGRAVVVTNAADSHGMIWYVSGNDWAILCQNESQSGDGNDNLATVWDGQYHPADPQHPEIKESTAVPHDKKKTRGALTVANLNDTDSNNTVDKTQNDANGVTGEKDLIRVLIQKPAADMGANDIEKIEFPKGKDKVEVWQFKEKKQKVNRNQDGSFSLGQNDFPNGNPKEIWIEGLNPSGELRDVELKISYTGKDGKLKSDTILITFVWAEFKRWRNTPNGKTTLNPDVEEPEPPYSCDGAIIKATFRTIYNSCLGITTGSVQGIQNGMQMEFKVYPPGVGADNTTKESVKFDVTRKGEANMWSITAGVLAPVPGALVWPEPDEQVNDEGEEDSNTCNDNFPGNDRIYSIDGPGYESQVGAVDEYIQRANFKEFVRVRFDGVEPEGDGIKGSRCSAGVRWRSITYTRNSGVGNVHVRASAKDQQGNYQDAEIKNPTHTPGRAGEALTDVKAKNCEVVNETWTVTLEADGKWKVQGSESGIQEERAETGVKYVSGTGGIEFKIGAAEYEKDKDDYWVFETKAATLPDNATATTPQLVSANPQNKGTMSAVTVYKDKTMSEDWTVTYKKDAQQNFYWEVRSWSSHRGGDGWKTYQPATTGQEYTADGGVIKFTISAGNAAFEENDKFTFSTRRIRENEIELEDDQTEFNDQSKFAKPIITH